jgi:hypothetical protein
MQFSEQTALTHRINKLVIVMWKQYVFCKTKTLLPNIIQINLVSERVKRRAQTETIWERSAERNMWNLAEGYIR